MIFQNTVKERTRRYRPCVRAKAYFNGTLFTEFDPYLRYCQRSKVFPTVCFELWSQNWSAREKWCLPNESSCFQQCETEMFVLTVWKNAPFLWFTGVAEVSTATGPPWPQRNRSSQPKLKSNHFGRPLQRVLQGIQADPAQLWRTKSGRVSARKKEEEEEKKKELANILTQLVIYLCATSLRFNRRREIHTHAHACGYMHRHRDRWSLHITVRLYWRCLLQCVCIYEFTRACARGCLCPYANVWCQVG